MKSFKIIISVFIIALIGLSTFFYFSIKKDEVNNENLSILHKFNLSEIIAPIKQKEIILPSDKLSLLFTGDIMLDRAVWLKTIEAGDYFYPFKNLDYFFDYDLRIGNLEGAITNFKSISNGTGGSRFFFTFSPEFLPAFKKYFSIFDLANNHTDNFEATGLKQTRDFLIESNINYFGDPNNVKENLSIIIEKNNIRIGLIGYNVLVANGLTNILLEINKIRPLVDYLIIMPHWGTEYATDKINFFQRDTAHQLIDASADIIIGTHPHVIQLIEEYNGKLIFYSLGNFIFDQYFSTETQQGLNLAIYLEKGNSITANYKLLPIEIDNNSQPALASDGVRNKIIDSLSNLSDLSTSTKKVLFE